MGLIVLNARIGYPEHDFITIYSGSYVAAHLTRITAHARGSELNACRQMPAFRMNGVCQRQAAADGYCFCTWYYLQNLKCCRGELRKRLWYRNVFIVQLGKAMIGRNKEIESTDMVVFIIRRPV